jgi:hypothetical protein
MINSIPKNKKLRNTVMLETKCQKGCKTCNHPLIVEIYEMKKAGKTLDYIAEKVNEKSEYKISKASLSRHFSKNKELVIGEAYRQQMEILQKEATDVLTYQKWTNKLLERTFQRIWKQFDNMNIDISDLERLSKLRVVLAQGDTSAGDGIVGVFDKAAERFGINFNQGNLFETEPKDPLKNAIDVEASSPRPCNQGRGAGGEGTDEAGMFANAG